MVKLSNTVWLNIAPEDVRRIDVDVLAYQDLKENAAYYVAVTLCDGTEHHSDLFKTFEEAHACAANLVLELEEE